MRTFAQFRRKVAVLSLVALVSQILLPAFTYAANPILSASLTQGNVPAGAQIVSLNVPRDLNPGDSLVFTMSGTSVVQTYDTSSLVTLGLLNVKIDALPEVTSTVDTTSRTYTVTSATPGVSFPVPTLTIQAAAQNFTTLVNNVVAVAQEAEFTLQPSLIAGDVVGMTVAGTGVVQNFTTNKSTTLTNLAAQITANTGVQASYSGATGKVRMIAKVPGTAFSLSNVVVGSSNVAPIQVQPNIVPVAQVNSIAIPRNIDAGETLSLTISGATIQQTYTGSSNTTIAALVNQIDALPNVQASLSGSAVVVTSAIPGTPFSISNLQVTGGHATLVNVHPNIVAVAQEDVLSFGRDFFAGDTLSGSINGTNITASFTGSSSALLNSIAGAIDALPHVAATANTVLRTITITSTSPGVGFASGVFALQTQLPVTSLTQNVVGGTQSESITIPRNLVAGDTLSVVLNGSTVTQTYTGSSNATITALANSLSGASINSSVSLATRTITVSATTAGVGFTLSQLTVLNQLSPTVIQNAVNPVKQVVVYSIPNLLIAGDSVSGNIAGSGFVETFATSDAATLQSVADLIHADPNVDAVADIAARTITVTAATAGVSFAATPLTITSANTSATQITANASEARASISVTVAQVPSNGDSIVLGGCLIQFKTGATTDYDCSNNTAQISVDSANTSTIAALLRGLSGINDPSNGVLSVSGSGNTAIFTRSTSQVGTTTVQFIDSSTAGTFTSTSVTGQGAVAQSETYTLPRTLVNGDTLTLTLDGALFTQTFMGNSASTLANLASNISSLPSFTATASGQTITVTAGVAGTGFTAGGLGLKHDSAASQTISSSAGSKAIQSIQFPSAFVSGDTVKVTVNGTSMSTPFSTDSFTTLLNVATAISGVSGVTASASGSNTLTVSTTATGASLVIGQVEVQNIGVPTVIQSNGVPTAQSDSFYFPYDITAGLTLVGTLSGATLSQPFSTDMATTLSLLAGKFEAAGPVSATYSGATKTLSLASTIAGAPYTATLRITGESISATNLVPNTASGAQVDQYTINRNLVSGEVLSVSINGTTLTQVFSTDTAGTLAALAAQIDALAWVTAVSDGIGKTITITAEAAGVAFTDGALAIDMSVPNTLITANVPAQTQIETLTIPRNLVVGDSLTTTIGSGSVLVSFSGSEADTLAAFVSQIDALPWVTATGSGLVVTVSSETAGIPFTLGSIGLSNTLAPAITVNNVSPVAQVERVALPVFVTGDIVEFSLNGVPLSVSYTSSDAATKTALFSAAQASGSVTATASGADMILTSTTPGTPFTLSALTVRNIQTATVVATNVPPVSQVVTVTPSNTAKKWTFRVTINGTNFDYLSSAGDTDATVATGIAGVITAPGVTATASGTNVILSANVPWVAFTYSAIAMDITAPAISDVVLVQERIRSGTTTQTQLSLDETGTLYFVRSGSTVATTADITALIANSTAFLGQANAVSGTAYSFTIPNGVQDGSYAAVAVDGFGNVSGLHTTGLVVDNTPPALVISTPNNQFVNQAAFTLTGTTEVGAVVTISGSGGTLTGSVDGGGTWSGTVTLGANASNTLTVTAVDSAGNSSVRFLTVTHDSITPVYTFATSASITNQTSVSFSGTTEAYSTLSILGGSGTVQVTALADGSYSGTLPLNRNQTNSLSLTIQDRAGNTSTGAASVIQDDIRPTVVLDIASGAIVDQNTFTITGNTEALASLAVFNQSGSVVATGTATSTGAFSIDATLIQDALNTLTVVATDAATNSGSANLSVTEDSVANTLLLSPLPAFTNQATVSVSGTTKNNSIVTFVQGVNTGSGTAGGGNFSFTVPLTANSLNTISLSSIDPALHVATGALTITHDSIAPTVSFATASGTLTSLTTYTLSGTTEPFASLTVSGGSGGVVGGTANGSGSYSIAVPLSIGWANVLTVTATDGAGNSGTNALTLIQDPIPLTLTIAPLSATVHGTTYTLTGSTKALATIAISGSATTTAQATASGTFSFALPLTADTVHTFTVRATDGLGSVLTQNVVITEDSTAPTLTLDTSNVSTNTSNYIITGTSEAGATLSATVASGSGAFTGAITAQATASGTFSLSIPLYSGAGVAILVKASDSVGNTSTGAQIQITQDSLAPSIGIQSFSGVTASGVTTGFYSFTTNEPSTATFYVGTGSNVLATLVWSGATVGLNHSGSLVGVNPLTSYYTFVRATDGAGNTTDSPVTPVTFSGSSSTATGSTGGSTSNGGSFSSGTSGGSSSGGSSSSSGGGGGGGGGNSGAPVATSASPLVLKTATGSTASGTTALTPTKPVTKTPVVTKKPTSSQKPTSSTTKPVVKTPTNTVSTPPKTPVETKSPGTAVDTPGFGYVIANPGLVPTSNVPENINYIYEPGVRYVSAANSVNIRTEPSASGKLVDVITRNSRVLLVWEVDGWGKIVSGGSTGWVRMEYLRGLQSADIARIDPRLFEANYAPEYSVVTAYVRAHALNVRSRPSGDARSVGQLPQGEKVYVLDTINKTWVEIRTKKGTGFVPRKWLK